MDTLRDRLSDLADDAPTGGSPPAVLWDRGTRAHRLRTAAVAAAVLVVGAAGVATGARLADGRDSAGGPEPAGTAGLALPITYPAATELPELGDAPGPLAALWLTSRVGRAPEVVGLVAETGTFGTIAVDLADETDPQDGATVFVALSPDGRRLAYETPHGELVVRDLVSGRRFPWSGELEPRAVGKWVGDTRLVGLVADGSDADGWLWEPGTQPRRVNPYLVPFAGTELTAPLQGGMADPGECGSPFVQDLEVRRSAGGDEWAGTFGVPALCSVLGITRNEVALGPRSDPDDGTVVALDLRDRQVVCQGSSRCTLGNAAAHRVVIHAGAPPRVALATGLFQQALAPDAGAP